MSRAIWPDGWPRAKGYSHGMAARGEVLAIAGQIGWDESQTLVSDDFVEQAAQALRNVMTVLDAAGGRAEDLIRMTWYVTDKHEYLANAQTVGELYRDIFGKHYPAMALVQVAALLEEGAKIEIEATAVIP